VTDTQNNVIDHNKTAFSKGVLAIQTFCTDTLLENPSLFCPLKAGVWYICYRSWH